MDDDDLVGGCEWRDLGFVTLDCFYSRVVVLDIDASVVLSF